MDERAADSSEASEPTDIAGGSASAPASVDAAEGEPATGRTVEAALAFALARAAAAERWDVVSQLARELEVRRLEAAGVASIAAERSRRGRP